MEGPRDTPGTGWCRETNASWSVCAESESRRVWKVFTTGGKGKICDDQTWMLIWSDHQAVTMNVLN